MFSYKNFHENTYCEFIAVNFDFSNVKTYTSKSGSKYHYTETGVYRYSNHWGRVANCRWKLKNIINYKNQNWYIGYADWNNFYSLTSSEKNFSINVDFSTQKVTITLNEAIPMFTISQALKRKKQIEAIFKNKKWLQYYDNPKEVEKQRILQILENKTI